MAQEAAVSVEHSNGEGVKTVSFTSFKPQLVLPASKAEEALQFYKAAFGAEELSRVYRPKRKAEQELPLIAYAELRIGASSLLICDQSDDFLAAFDGSGAGIIFRVEAGDVAAAVAKAVEAGAVAEGEVVEVEGGCGGGVLGKVKDPFGVIWAITSTGKKGSDVAAE
ncbi:hypothetical protein HPP92_023882 [Vanilla planifolia]|uniref:VOC domain-containing protein n=1 Tax=Vanilla planifolia TaxID=51239 RepID=A0A835PMJ4_VANPL|nr:hypothetical protein HPP92_023882 [Vanilla planifolia]